jgi:hypothetical protein
MVGTIMHKTKRKVKEMPNDTQRARPKKKEKGLVLVVGNYVTHICFHVTYMQIMTSNSNRKLKTNISSNQSFSM